MSDAPGNSLNYYSKYTRAKDKHLIESLYSLLDSQASSSRLSQFTLLLNCSKIEPADIASHTKRSQDEDDVLL